MLLANLLDNAIRASEECEEEHTIYFTMRLIDGTLSLDIQNTYQGPVTIVDNELRSTKREDDRHGYGIKNVQHVVANYGGTFRLSLERRLFGIHITINRGGSMAVSKVILILSMAITPTVQLTQVNTINKQKPIMRKERKNR